MKRLLVFFTSVLMLFSCSKNVVLLPQIAISGPSEIQNHSEIWVFQEQDKGLSKARVNKNNIIGSTHWIVNIDKRLSLNEVIPILQMIKAKRVKKTLHSVEGMKTYLSYSNTIDKNIALFSIDEIQYMMQSIEELEELQNDFSSDYTIRFFTNIVEFNGKTYSVDNWKSISFDLLKTGSIQLYFNSQLTYQEYLEFRMTIQSKLNERISLNSIEYIIK